MPPSVLGVGIPATAPGVPPHLREPLQKALDVMDSSMASSPYKWEMFYIVPDSTDYDLFVQKLKEKKWDLVMVGKGLRTGNTVPLFEKIVNTVHEELPTAKFVFNVEIEKTVEACERVMPSQ